MRLDAIRLPSKHLARQGSKDATHWCTTVQYSPAVMNSTRRETSGKPAGDWATPETLTRDVSLGRAPLGM